MVEALHERGWVRFPHDQVLADWAVHAMPAARASVSDPVHAEWHDCERTWFIGVDALDNDAQGMVAGSPALGGAAIELAHRQFGPIDLHKRQVSVIYLGYP